MVTPVLFRGCDHDRNGGESREDYSGVELTPTRGKETSVSTKGVTIVCGERRSVLENVDRVSKK